MSRNDCITLQLYSDRSGGRAVLKHSKTFPAPGGTLLGLQALRAAACLLVVAYHAVEAWGRMAPGRHQAEPWPNGSAGVDLFFVISGFVMFTSSRRLASLQGGWRVFMLRRLERIVPLYWLLTLVKMAITLAKPDLTPTTRLADWNLAASFLFIPARDAAGVIRPVLPVGWTLNYEMLFYLVFAASLALRRKPLAVLLPVLVPLGVAGFWRTGDWPAVLSLANGLVLELCAGVALAEAVARGWRPRAATCTAMAAAGFLLLMLMPATGPWRFLAWGAPALLVVAGTIGLEARLRLHLPRLLLELGDASYAIYLSHVFIVPVLAHAVMRTGLSPVASLTGLIVASLVVCSAAGIALNALVDAPVQAWLHRRRVAAV